MSKEKNRISRLFFFEGISFGLFIATVAVSCIELVRIVLGEFRFSESPWTLILPIVASTYISIRSITEQSKIQMESEIEKYQRETMLAQAELPVSLSGLTEMCGDMLNYHFLAGKKQVNWRKFDAWLEGLKPSIKSSSPRTAERLLKIIRTYQVLRARMRDFDDGKRDLALLDRSSWTYHGVWASAINWATLYAMLEQAFAYARGTESDIPSDEVNDRVFSAFFICNITYENYPLLSDLLIRRKENGFEINFASD